MAVQVTGLRSSFGAPCIRKAIGRMVAAATITVTAGTAMPLSTLGARRMTTIHDRKISSEPSDNATPSGEPAPSGLPAIRAAPSVAAATPAQVTRLTRSPSNLAEMAI
jgi:hypothetical protein